MIVRVADYIMKRIVEEGVEHLFYVPGGQCVYLMDALRRNNSLEGIATHHEQAASMAALSYSLYNGTMGACLVTTGCAGTNTMTGVLHAWQDSIPCIFVSGQQAYSQTVKASGLALRQVGVQEADIESIVKPITKYAVTVDDENMISYHLDKAFYLAKSGRKGPVWIDVPLNIQNAMVDEEKLVRFNETEEEKPCPFGEDISYVNECLKQSKRPVILAGHGVRTSRGIESLKLFADKYNIPITFSRFSNDYLPYDDKLNMGVVSGVAGASRYGNFAIQNSDLVISVGCRLSIDTTGPEREKFAREAKIIVVDIDKEEHKKQGVKIDKFIYSDAKLFLDEMLKEELMLDTKEWIDKCIHWKNIFSYDSPLVREGLIDAKSFMLKLSDLIPDNGVVVSDAGFTGALVPAATNNRESHRIIHSFAQGEMGYSLPAACGIATLTDAPIISYTGDGSFMMNLQELQTVVRNNFNIKIIIINNNGYSGVRHGQKAHFRGKSIGTDPSNGVDFPDYEKIAAAFNIKYVRVSDETSFESAGEAIFKDNNPVICEVMCDPEQFDLHNALVSYDKRKFGFRPIEDQSPFIERDIFFKEMIVEPMETSYGTPM